MKKTTLILFSLTYLQTSSAMLPRDEYWPRSADEQKPTLEETHYKDFWTCIKNGHKQDSLLGIRALVAAGCDINAYYYGHTFYKVERSFNGDTALTYFAKHGPASVYELLIHLKADVNLPNKATGDTPLIIALKVSHYQLCLLLIKSGADVNAKNKLGQTALLLAISRRHLGLVQILIARGADITTQSRAGQTPLLLAAQGGDEKICKLLIEQPKIMNDRIITFLWCLKSIGQHNKQLKFLYDQREKLLRPHLEKLAINLQELLNARDNYDRRAYDCWDVEWLKPHTLKHKGELPQ